MFCNYFLDVLTFSSVYIWLSESGRFAIAVYYVYCIHMARVVHFLYIKITLLKVGVSAQLLHKHSHQFLIRLLAD